MGHGVTKCRNCHEIITQCRCIDHNAITWDVCEKCQKESVTIDEWEKEELGKELDAQIAERVMEWNREGSLFEYPVKHSWISISDLPKFSTEIEAAFEVIERLHKEDLTFQLQQSPGGNWRVTVYANTKNAINDWYSKELLRITGATAPLAICKAALEIVSFTCRKNGILILEDKLKGAILPQNSKKTE